MKILLHIYVYGLLSTAGMLPAAARAAAPEQIDEITITAEQGEVNLQMAIDTAEDDFYTLLNEHLDEEFRISCKEEVVLGSRIRKRVCQTGYMQDELTTAAIYSYNGIPYLASAALAEKNSRLRDRTRELIETNPELRDAVSRLSGLVDAYRQRYLTE